MGADTCPLPPPNPAHRSPARRAYALPATHFAPGGDKSSDSPWMGLRVRLSSTYNCNGLSGKVARVFCVALQKYGGIFADNGSRWFFT
jgi:hypothetical protein